MFDEEENEPFEEEEYTVEHDLVDRVEEAQQSIAWAVQIYVEFYGHPPPGKTYHEMMDHLLEVKNAVKARLASETLDDRFPPI
jgi:hypothetical protein